VAREAWIDGQKEESYPRQDGERWCDVSNVQFESYELFISGNFHLLFSGYI
jgi:hypothetical protein